MNTTDKRFELVQRREIPELASTALLYRHIQTGAELLSIENDDTNKVFGIAFRTPPQTSNGIAHILEHSVLCGSRKYPAKDPFVQLLKGSLQTFLNAMTYPDKTVYPVASQNLRDFYNLVDVYLDAVFYPRLTPDVLAQEGWHYAYDEERDELAYSGVVFNEMKGNYSTADYLLYEGSQNILFPELTYANDSGGNPEAIPELAFEEFKRFHEDYYHPSNARLFFWGDDDPAERLRLAAEYLDAFEYRRIESSVPAQSAFSEGVEAIRKYPASESELDDHRVTLNWMLADVSDADMLMQLQILEQLLVGSSASPLRKALIESGLGDDLTGAGFDSHTRQSYFSTGLRGVAGENLDKVVELVDSTLRNVCAQGFEADLIDSTVNTLEFKLRENNTGRTPRGLALMLRTLKAWLHDFDPFAMMSFEDRLQGIKDALSANPRHFEELLESCLIDNRHRAVFKLIPDPVYAAETEKLEREALNAIRARLSAAELAEIVAAEERLRQMQETPDPPEVLAKIPALALADIPLENEIIPARIEQRDDACEIIHHDLFTNGILYLDIGFDTSDLSEEELLYLPILSDALIEMGTSEEDYVSLSKRIGRETGGIDTSPLIAARRDDAAPGRYLNISGKCLIERSGRMLAIFADMLCKLKLDDRERMLQIAQEAKADAESSLLPDGHSVAAGRIGARLSGSGRIGDIVDGVEQLIFLRRFIDDIKSDWGGVLRRLSELREKVVNRSGMFCNATIDAANWERIANDVERFCADFPQRGRNPRPVASAERSGHEFLLAESQVQYVGKGVRIRDYGSPVKGSELVAVRYLRTSWLWDQIRVQGGAYGALATVGSYSGIFAMASYRDPQIDRSLEIYDKTGEHLLTQDIGKEELERAIIGTIGGIDTYRLPDSKGRLALMNHLVGKSEEDLQRLREEVLATSPDDLRRFGESIAAMRDQGTVVILGSSQHLAQSDFARLHSGDIEETQLL
jgi:presequence protease